MLRMPGRKQLKDFRTLQMRRIPHYAARGRRPTRLFGYIALVPLLFVAAQMLQNAALGQYLAIGYGIVALIVGIRSQDTFKMALIALAVAAGLSAVQNTELSSNFSIYAFLLLCFGAIDLVIEQRRIKHNIKRTKRIGAAKNIR